MKSLVGRILAATALALGGVVVLTPAAHADSIITRPTAFVWTGPNALANCRAQGQWEMANNDWDTYRCYPDNTVDPSGYRLYMGIWVGCPTCAPTNATDNAR